MLTIHKASAGSGKTYQLAREYIKYILGKKTDEGSYTLEPVQGERHRKLLAITFTNKATEEMKRRIVHQLAVLAGMEPGWKKKSDYLDDFVKEFGCTERQLAEAAADALRGVLFDFGALNISTIDSFFQSILRSFAREAEVNGNYSIEIDQKEIIEESVDEMLSLINRANPTRETRWLLNWIEKYMLSRIEKGEKFSILDRSVYLHSDLIDFISQLTNDDFRENEADIIDYLREEGRLEKFISAVSRLPLQYMERVRAAADEVFRLLGDRETNPGLNSHLYNAITNWGKTGLYINKQGKIEVPATVIKIYNGESSMTVKTKKFNASPELEAAVLKCIDEILQSIPAHTFLSIIRANLYQLGIMRPLADRLDLYRHEHQAILLADTNKIINSIISDTDSPFLYERLGTRYEHYLIDEFQDTSVSQWENLEPLLRETEASGLDSLIIGDVKQSIYRFRNSDSSLLGNLDRTFEGSTVRGDLPSENTNWRSSADVVTFNNAFFSRLAAVTGFSSIYANVVQGISPKHKNHRGYVEFTVFDEKAMTGTDKKSEVVDYMAAHLRRQLDSGYRPCDIAFLVRTKSEGEKIINRLRVLAAADPTWPQMRIVSDKSLVIETVPAISYIVSQLRLLSASDSRKDKRSATERERALFVNEYESRLSALSDPAAALTGAVEKMRNVKKGLDTITLPSLPAMTDHDMISLVEGLIRGLTPDARRRDALALATFQDMVASFVNHGNSDLRAFLEWWDYRGHLMSVPTAKDEEAINVLTMHKSKGLEWKCVFVPFADLWTNNKADIKWFDIRGKLPDVDPDIIPPMVPIAVSKKLENTPLAAEYAQSQKDALADDLNLLYVALTRATDELIVGLNSSTHTDIGKAQLDVLAPLPGDLDGALISEVPSEKEDEEDENEEASSSPIWQQRLTMGSPTKPQASEAERSTAIEASSSTELEGYPIEPVRNMWKGTQLQLDAFNHIDIARERGLIVHEVMAGVRHKEDVDDALRRFRITPDGVNMTGEEFEALASLIRTRVDNPLAAEWFVNTRQVMMERSIAVPGKKPRRFDRVVWTSGGEIHIVDYKTGHQPSKRYRKQMAEYKRLISTLYTQPVRAFLYYLDSGEIVEMY